MKKFLLAILLLLVIAALALWFSLDWIAKNAVERGTSHATGVPAEAGNLRLGIFSGQLALQDMRIANPPGYEAEHIFVLQALDLGVHPRSLLHDVVRVPRLTVNGVQLNLEREGGRANYVEILENVRRLGDAAPGTEDDEEKRFIIEELRIDSVRAEAVFARALGERGRTTVEVPAIALHNVGAETGGVTLAELAGIMAREIMREVARSGRLPAQFQEQLNAAIGRVRGLKGEVRRETEQQRERLQQEAERAIEEQRQRLLEEGEKLFP